MMMMFMMMMMIVCMCSDMVTQLLSYMGDDLETKMDDCCSSINLSHTSFDTDMEPK